jgi:hypothetical protein
LAKLRIAKQLEMEGNKLIFRAFFVAGNRLRGGGGGLCLRAFKSPGKSLV